MAHRGKIVKKIVEDSGVNVTVIREKTGKSRTTLYRWFDEDDLPYAKIELIGSAINHDFTQEFPDMVVSEPVGEYRVKSNLQLQAEVEFWRDKYIRLLERYNKILGEKLGIEE
nr:hypothetical protein [uncultured Pedobacter sp.]